MEDKKELPAWLDEQTTRRHFVKKAIEVGAVVGAATSGLAHALQTEGNGPTIQLSHEEFDFVIVGSGAGGGPLAVNLAKAGFTVLVLEAGDEDPSDDIHNIPAWHPLSSEDPKLSWNFFVKHYASTERQQRDSKYVPGKGILYPRASTIGGCAAHHAMITVYPHNTDFDRIADITGDDSWDSSKMRRYFQRLEKCEYIPRPLFNWLNFSRHGFDGWLPTNNPDVRLLLEDNQVLDFVVAGLAHTGFDNAIHDVLAGNVALDLNHWQVAAGKDGAFLPPMSVNRESRRSGIREYLLENRARYPDRLIIRTGALATRVLFDERTAVGVEYLQGSKLYKADAYYNEHAIGQLKQVRASKEVILAGGAFNSPQLLKLSGIGPALELQQHGISVKVDLPGVGENLQDRYEIGVVYDLKESLTLTKNCSFGGENDPCLDRYKNNAWSRGPYSSNGLSLALVERSKPELQDPDLFIFSLPGSFHGYYPGYSNEVVDYKDRFSWLVLKGHTNNSAGRVMLTSNNPQDMPEINFHYFEEGNDASGDDLRAVVKGVKSVRHIMNKTIAKRHVQQEALPGDALESDDAIGNFVRNEAWGHHASCTNKMGVAGDPRAVVDSRFQVFGTKNLRVVDASVFPYIPGFFIVTPTYMISEKASDVILEDVLRKARRFGFE